MDDVEATIVTLTMCDDTNTTHVATTRSHSNHTGVKSDEILNLAILEADLDSVIDLDDWIRVADPATPFVSVSNTGQSTKT